MKLNKKELYLIKKALKICIIKYNHKGQKINDIDSRILANKFEKVYEKTKHIDISNQDEYAEGGGYNGFEGGK